MDCLGVGFALVRLARRQAASPNRLFPDRIRDLVVFSRPFGIAHVLRYAGIPGLREERFPVVADRSPVPVAKARADATISTYGKARTWHGALAACLGAKIDLL